MMPPGHHRLLRRVACRASRRASALSSPWDGDGVVGRVSRPAPTEVIEAMPFFCSLVVALGDRSLVTLLFSFSIFPPTYAQRTSNKWEHMFRYEKGRILGFSYLGVRYYSTFPCSYARSHA